MSLIAWNKSYSVGVEDMDIQHKQLLVIMNNLNDAIQAGKGQEALQEVFDDLIAYTRQHFAEEEKFMRDNEYPERDTHLKAHRELEKKVVEYRDMFKEGVAVAGSDVLDFLKEWLIMHILKMDKKYGQFFAEKQAKK